MSITTGRATWWIEDEWRRFETLSLDAALGDIEQVVQSRFAPANIAVIQSALSLAEKEHLGHLQRRTGRLQTRHLLAVTRTVAELGLDPKSVAAALLHDVIEDTDLDVQELGERFGVRIASLVDAVTKVETTAAHQSRASVQRLLFKKVLDSLAEDPEDLPAWFIKLAEKLDHMRFSAPHLPPAQRLDMAREVMHGYTALAERLGAWELKAQLEDLAFRYLSPEEFQQVERQLETQAPYRRDILDSAVHDLEVELQRVGIEATVDSRTKHMFSTYDKMRRKSRTLTGIHDLIGLRVIVERDLECFRVLGVAHSLWHPLVQELDDYISTPKPNGYQSLHTTVISPAGFALEIQIRTKKMHEVAEFGLAAHWRYRGQDKDSDEFLNAQLSALQRQLGRSREISDEGEFIEAMKYPLLQDQIHVYSATGEFLSLPEHATPLDLAYELETISPETCIGARVGTRQVPINWPLRTGDRVTILTGDESKGPERDWFSFVKTSLARESIRAHFQKYPEEVNIQEARSLLRRELALLDIDLSLEEAAMQAGYSTHEKMLRDIGFCEVSVRDLSNVILMRPYQEHILQYWALHTVRGMQALDPDCVFAAECCRPEFDEPLEAIFQGSVLMVHGSDCPVLQEHTDENTIEIPVLDPSEVALTLKFVVRAYDRIGLLNELTDILVQEKINIRDTGQTTERHTGVSSIALKLDVPYSVHVVDLLHELELVPNVADVRRVQMPAGQTFEWKIHKEPSSVGRGLPPRRGGGADKWGLQQFLDEAFDLDKLALLLSVTEEELLKDGIDLPVAIELFGHDRAKPALILELIGYLDRRDCLQYLIRAIRGTYPLFSEVRGFLTQAGFAAAVLASDPFGLLCTSDAPFWSEVSPAYVRLVPGRELNLEEFRVLCEKAREVYDGHLHGRTAFVVIDRQPRSGDLHQIFAVRSHEGLTVVPLPRSLLLHAQLGESEAERLREQVELYAGRSDLYDTRTAVTDILSFFGHAALIGELTRQLVSGQSAIVFGVRKAGKSSLLGRLREECPWPVALVDLQGYGGQPEYVYGEILRAWWTAIAMAYPDLYLPELTDDLSVEAQVFRRTAVSLVDHLAAQPEQPGLCLFLDEMDAIFGLEQYQGFAAVLRSLAEDPRCRGRIAIVAAGLEPHPNRLDRMGGQRNPFYAFFREARLGTLDLEDARTMVVSIGAQMGVAYEEDALDLLVTEAGGHPFLIRQLCSQAIRELGRPCVVDLSQLAQAMDKYMRSPRNYLAESIWGIDSGGPPPPEAALLRTLAMTQPQSDEVLIPRVLPHDEHRKLESALAHLCDQSLIRRTDRGWELTMPLYRHWIRYFVLNLPA